MQTRREWINIFKVLKGKNLQPRMVYPARISFRREGERKNFSDKEKLKEKSNIRPILEEILRSFLIIKESRIYRKENITIVK